MTKLKRTEDGGYLIKGKKYETLRGTRRQVYEYETAYKTAGGLLKGDLVQNDKGRIVSKAKFDDGPNLLKNLTKRGFFTKKGKFGHTKMKTRKLRKKLTQKNKRKMKGGESIQGIKDKLKLVKNMIPNKIAELKKNPAYVAMTSTDQTGNIKEAFEANVFKPLETLNKEIQEPITQVETAIDTFEAEARNQVETGKKTLKDEVEKQFKKLDELIDKGFETILKEAKKIIPGASFMPDVAFKASPGGAALYAAKTGLKTVISSKKDDILKKIDAIDFDTLVEAATTAAATVATTAATAATSKSPSSSSNEKPAEENKEASGESGESVDSGDSVGNVVTNIVNNFTKEQKEKYDDAVEKAKIAAVNELSKEKDELAELAAKQLEDLANIGGKKKSKGKK